jgi:hypothetical protein
MVLLDPPLTLSGFSEGRRSSAPRGLSRRVTIAALAVAAMAVPASVAAADSGKRLATSPAWSAPTGRASRPCSAFSPESPRLMTGHSPWRPPRQPSAICLRSRSGSPAKPSRTGSWRVGRGSAPCTRVNSAIPRAPHRSERRGSHHDGGGNCVVTCQRPAGSRKPGGRRVRPGQRLRRSGIDLRSGRTCGRLRGNHREGPSERSLLADQRRVRLRSEGFGCLALTRPRDRGVAVGIDEGVRHPPGSWLLYPIPLGAVTNRCSRQVVRRSDVIPIGRAEQPHEVAVVELSGGRAGGGRSGFDIHPIATAVKGKWSRSGRRWGRAGYRITDVSAARARG